MKAFKHSLWTSFYPCGTGWPAMGEMTGASAMTNQVMLASSGVAGGLGWPEEKSSMESLSRTLCWGVWSRDVLWGMWRPGRELLGKEAAGYLGCWGYIMSEKCRKLKDALRIWSSGRKLRKETEEGGGKFFGNCSLGLALVLNQSFLFLQRCTLRQGPKIDLGMFQALYSVVSTYHTIPLQEPYC